MPYFLSSYLKKKQTSASFINRLQRLCVCTNCNVADSTNIFLYLQHVNCLIRRLYSGSFQNLSLPNTSGLRGSEMAGHEQQILHFITPRSASTVSQENSWRHLVWNTILRLLESYSLSSNFVFRFAFFSAPVLSLTGFGDFVTNSSMIAWYR